MKTMLFAFPHPDDESISCGGSIYKYFKNGWQIHLVCATNGETGSKGSYSNASSEQLAVIRRKELEKAASTLGISSITFLGCKDGKLAEQTPGELEDILYRKISELAPDIVITYEPKGVTNHPDHVKFTTVVTYAFQKYAQGLIDLNKINELKGVRVRDLTRVFRKSFMECVEKEDDPKLYYVCLPERVVVYLQKMKAFSKESYGKPMTGVADDLITTVIDIKKYTSTKIRALREHESQREDFEAEINMINNPEFLNEFYILRMHGVSEVYMGKNDRVSSKF